MLGAGNTSFKKIDRALPDEVYILLKEMEKMKQANKYDNIVQC